MQTLLTLSKVFGETRRFIRLRNWRDNEPKTFLQLFEMETK